MQMVRGHPFPNSNTYGNIGDGYIQILLLHMNSINKHISWTVLGKVTFKSNTLQT